jgi:uncharacterized DUF497 family protein
MLTVVKLAVEPETAAWLATAPAIEWDAGNIARRGDKLRPISCRAMRRKEKEAYDAAT